MAFSLKYTVIGLSVFGSLLLSDLSSAKELELKTCMASVQNELGVNADIAYSECSKRTFAECIKNMTGNKFIARSVAEKGDRFIVDLGNDYGRWMEGHGWRAKGCEPYGEGPARHGYYANGWGTQKRSFFRQGNCKSPSVKLDQINTIHEAEILCKSVN